MAEVFRLFRNCIAELLLGATVMTMIIYFLNNPNKNAKDFHAILTTIGFNFLSVQAVLWLNHWNGWSCPMLYRCIHICLQVCGITCGMIGGVVAIIDYGVSGASGAHEISGVVALILALVSSVLGITALITDYEVTLVHLNVGLLTVFTYSLSFILGLVLPPFKIWAGPTLWITMIVLICLYCLLIAITTYLKFINSVRSNY